MTIAASRWIQADQSAARSPGQAAAADRRSVRNRHLRRHRRPRPQEADAGDLRPGQSRAAAARLRAGRVRPPGLGERGLQPRWSTTPSGSTREPRSPKRSGGTWRRDSGSSRAPSTTTTRSTPWPRPWPTSTGSAAPAATTRSTSRSRRARSRWCCEQLKRSGLCEPHGEEWRRVVIEKPFGHDLEVRASS